jgi:hypothetical protein
VILYVCMFKDIWGMGVKLHTSLTSPNDGDEIGNFTYIVPILFSYVPFHRNLMVFELKVGHLWCHLNLTFIHYVEDFCSSACVQCSCLSFVFFQF